MTEILLAVCPACGVDALRLRLVRRPGTAVVEAFDGASAVQLARDESFDAALMDIDLGAGALRRVAQLLPDRAHLVILPGHPWSATPEAADAIAGAVLGPRRPRTRRIVVGDIVLDRGNREVWRGDRRVHLTPRTYRLLEVLMEHAGSVVSSERLFATVWGGWQRSNVLHVYARYLRTALESGGEPRALHTLRGIGYRLDPQP